MKKTVLVFSMVLMLLASMILGACTGGNDPTAEPGTEDTKTADKSTGAEESESGNADAGDAFKVGYARENITPKADQQLPLAGYGNTAKRLSTGFLDYIFITCIAFRDTEGNTLLWFTEDLINANIDVVPKMKAKVSEVTGIDTDHILVTGTHTHSCVDQSQTKFDTVVNFLENLIAAAGRTAEAAIADLTPATFNWGSADLTGYNYVRHYFTDLGEAVGDNHGKLAAGTVVRHATEANSEMSILEIKRDGAKDVLLTTWRAHATITGGSTKRDISSDFIGSVRDVVEKNSDYLFAYYQGEAGNMNPRTKLNSDVEYNPPDEVKKYGQEVAEIILKSLADNGTTPIQTGTIQTINTTFTGEVNHDWDSLVSVAQTLSDEWANGASYESIIQEGVKYEITDSLGNVHHIESPYQAQAIVSHAKLGKTHDVEIHATRIGDFAFVNAPFEVFDTNGDFVKANSPSAYTMVIGYSNQGQGYLPSQYAYEYGCYESDTTKFKPGTGEQLASKFVELLNELYK